MRVLVADDDPVVALALAHRLRSLGHEPVGPVADGAAAVAEAASTGADLYLFDVEMPGLNGLDAAAHLAALGLRRPVVIVTGLDDPALVDRSIAVGVGAYLTKPVDTLQLDAAVRLAAARDSELETLEAEVATAKQALEDRKVVERAKGILTKALQLPEPDAFRRMQQTARARNLRLVEVARQIIEQQSLLEPNDRA